ncbi:MAG: hypothetical protein IPM20_00660 [Gammaproteobacteria bacterium]|nr:hypothetical protein [Gammaproteobacteria bacterium]
MGNDDKVNIISGLITLRGKLLGASLKMKLKGEDTTELEKSEQLLEEKVQELRSELHRTWQGSADDMLGELAATNRRIQSRIRDLERDEKRAEKAVEILGQVEGLVGKIASLLG